MHLALACLHSSYHLAGVPSFPFGSSLPCALWPSLVRLCLGLALGSGPLLAASSCLWWLFPSAECWLVAMACPARPAGFLAGLASCGQHVPVFLCVVHFPGAHRLWCLSFTWRLGACAFHVGLWHAACLPLGSVAVPCLPCIRPVLTFCRRVVFSFGAPALVTGLAPCPPVSGGLALWRNLSFP